MMEKLPKKFKDILEVNNDIYFSTNMELSSAKLSSCIEKQSIPPFRSLANYSTQFHQFECLSVSVV